MEFIIQNWSELNFMDRVWFLVGGWLLILFLTVMAVRIFNAIFRRGSKSPAKVTNPNLPKVVEDQAR